MHTDHDGYWVDTSNLGDQARSLRAIKDETDRLLRSAGELAQRQPQLGTSPPAMLLAMRLREAAGRAGLTGQVSAADQELDSFQQALSKTVSGYHGTDSHATSTLRKAAKDLRS